MKVWVVDRLAKRKLIPILLLTYGICVWQYDGPGNGFVVKFYLWLEVL